MSKVDVNKEFYNKLYKKRNPFVSRIYSLISFDQQSKSKINFKIIKEHFGNRFQRVLNVLDYGFGHGSLLLKYPKHYLLHGCDISEEAVHNFPSVAESTGRKAITATVEEFFKKFHDTKFDVISLSHIIEHVDDDKGLLSSLVPLLSEEGVMLINIPINEVWKDPKHVRPYDIVYTRQLCESVGLDIVRQLETDKLTSFFLTEEYVIGAGKLKKMYIKLLRLFFALMPLAMITFVEDKYLKKHNYQQLIVLACRKK